MSTRVPGAVLSTEELAEAVIARLRGRHRGEPLPTVDAAVIRHYESGRTPGDPRVTRALREVLGSALGRTVTDVELGLSTRRANLLLWELRCSYPAPDDPTRSLSQAALADLATAWLYEHGHRTEQVTARAIEDYERGEYRWPRRPVRDALRAVLGRGRPLRDEDMGFHKTWSTKRPTSAIAPPRSPSTRGGVVGAPSSVLPAVRRSRSTLVTTTTMPEVLMAAAEESRELRDLLRSTNLEATADVAQLLADLTTLTRNYLLFPLPELVAELTVVRQRAKDLLARPGTPGTVADALSVVGWSTVLLAWMSIDQGRVDDARTHAGTALEYGRHSGDSVLLAWVYSTLHTLEYWRGDYVAAAEHARTGLALGRTGSARVFLSGALALDLARAGDRDGAVAQLHDARRALDLFTPAPGELEGPLLCTPARADTLLADVHTALGDTDAALSAAEAAIATYAVLPQQRRNVGTLRMAHLLQGLAHVQHGDIPAARQALDPVLGTEPEQRPLPLRKRSQLVLGELTTLITNTGSPSAAAIELHRDLEHFVGGGAPA
ncbi:MULTISPECIES: hypothetical protein [Actinosynnema]|uniref:hypothetical protein n=1 Tax=Actinosynnema TaxID=40566 RepID=UPI0020A372DA|nr:hypothetical protein [Actinosynnema pretiosum]MCP2097413.1 hypothetical protein [Actinosynnema pretiosum]